MQFYVKDPGAVLDYSINWDGGYLQSGETLASSVWTIFPGDMTQSSAGNTAGVASITVSGGVAGQIYQLTSRITTSQGRTDVPAPLRQAVLMLTAHYFENREVMQNADGGAHVLPLGVHALLAPYRMMRL